MSKFRPFWCCSIEKDWFHHKYGPMPTHILCLITKMPMAWCSLKSLFPEFIYRNTLKETDPGKFENIWQSNPNKLDAFNIIKLVTASGISFWHYYSNDKKEAPSSTFYSTKTDTEFEDKLHVENGMCFEVHPCYETITKPRAMACWHSIYLITISKC